MRFRLLGSLALTLTVLGAAGPAEAQSAAPKETPAPELELSVDERGPGRPWSMSLVNTGSRPAVVVADPRLLWFDVKTPSKKQSSPCRLPSELFPDRPDPRTVVVLEPGEGVAQSFDPRLYCFAAGGQWQLVPGSLVTPHFGWPAKKKTVWKNGKKTEETPKQQPPFMAGEAPEKGEESRLDEAGVKEVSTEPFSLRSDYAEWSRTRIEGDRKAMKGPLEIKVTQGSDASAERNATVSITLRNKSKRAEWVYFRRELVSFEVMRPEGLTTCDAQPDTRAPDRQAFSRLGPGGSMSFASRLVELCPRGTFAQPGLYLVHARFDSTEPGDDFNLDAFQGRVISPQPATVRIRTGEQPFLRKKRMYKVRVQQPQQ